ncbi:MAG TPA: TetR/AcrR family transcriptional regulator [Solimonas sp.]|nr:TetR/AcrR family transcriptional regulator [Solimonas sp.]
MKTASPTTRSRTRSKTPSPAAATASRAQAPRRRSPEATAAAAERAPRRGYGGRSGAELMAERRDRLLAAGMDLYATRGYAHTPIELLCAQARVTTRHFYEQFESREALLSALYERIVSELRDAVLRALQTPGLTPEQRIEQAIRALVESYVGDPRRARIGVLEAVGVSAGMERRRREVIHDFARVLEAYAGELARQGLVPVRDYHLISVALVGGINELLAEWLTTEHPPGTAQLVEVISELLRALLLGGRALRGAPGAAA